MLIKASVRQPGKETFYWVSRRRRPAIPHCLILRARVISVGGWACLAFVRAGVRFHSGVRVKGKDLQAFGFLLTQTSHYYPAGNGDDYTRPWLKRTPRQNCWKSNGGWREGSAMRSLAALQEYPSSTASTQMAAASNSSSGRVTTPSSDFSDITCMWCTDIYVGKTPIHTKVFLF